MRLVFYPAIIGFIGLFWWIYTQRAALRRLGVSPEAALMVGNGLRTDIQGAQGVGIQSVLVERGDPHGAAPSTTPDFTIGDLDRLGSVIGRLPRLNPKGNGDGPR